MRTKILMVLVLITSISVTAQTKKWTLQECVSHAIENNISIKQSTLNTDLAEEDILSAKGNFLPSLNGSASQGFNFGSFIDNSGSRVSRDSRGYSFGLNGVITLFNGFRNTTVYDQAKLGLESSKLQLDILKDDISLNVVNSYLNVLFNKESLKIANDQIKVSQKQVDELQELVNAGVRARADLFDVQAKLASDQERVVTAQNSIDLSLLSLAQLLQISHRRFDVQDVNIDVSSVALLYNDTDEIYNNAVVDRPEIRKAQLDIEDSELGIKIAKSGFFPTLSASAGVGTNYQHSQGQEDVRPIIDPNNPNNVIFVPNGFGKQIEDNLGYNLGLSLRIPIFNGFQNKVAVNRAIINNKRVSFRKEQAEQDLRSKIERAYADAKATLNQYEASKTSVKAQEESFKNAQNSYDLGAMTSFEFDQVRNRLVNAQSALINAKYNFLFKSKLLEFYYGIPIVIE